VDWFHVTQDGDQWWARMSNFRFHYRQSAS